MAGSFYSGLNYVGAQGFTAPPPVASFTPTAVPARGPGYRVRLRKIPGHTDNAVLAGALYLQVGPVGGDFSVSETAEHTEYRTIASGEFSAPAPGRGTAGRSLRSTSFTTLTINWDAPWLINHDITPAEMRAELYDILRRRTPFELLVTRSLPEHGGSNHELLMNATLRSITRTTRGKEADTRYYDLAFREWRLAKVGRRSASGSAGSGRSGASKNTNGRYRKP